jgi:hypothetical protein
VQYARHPAYDFDAHKNHKDYDVDDLLMQRNPVKDAFHSFYLSLYFKTNRKTINFFKSPCLIESVLATALHTKGHAHSRF